MIRVLAISHTYVASENQKNLRALAQQADVQAVVPHYIHDTVFERLEASPDDSLVKIYRRISFPRSQYLLMTLDMGMRDFKPDIVHIEYDPWSIIFWQMSVCRALFARNAKIVCTVKKNTYRKLPAPLAYAKKMVARRFIRKVTAFVAASEAVKKIYQENFRVAESKISVVQHLGFDSSLFHGLPHQPTGNRCVVGYCGRFDENKGILDLIDAVQQWNDGEEWNDGERAKVNLRLLGSGPLLSRLRCLNHEWLELIDTVPHSEVAEFMRSLDIFVMPSRITADHEEHDGHALMEALACGVASIGSTSGIIPELLGDNLGLIFPSGDCDALASSLGWLVSDVSLRREMSARGEKYALQHFSIEGIANQKMEIYRTSLA